VTTKQEALEALETIAGNYVARNLLGYDAEFGLLRQFIESAWPDVERKAAAASMKRLIDFIDKSTADLDATLAALAVQPGQKETP
jgi:hypothetical protein